MTAKKTKMQGILVIEPKVYKDNRGFFMESFNKKKYKDIGVNKEFVQDNISFNIKNVLRGLHFQNPNSQAKLISVIEGEVYDIVVDLRQGSPTFGCWEGFILSGDNCRQLYIQEGFAHGFVVLSDKAYFNYKCSEHYSPEDEICILWNDPYLGIDWKVDNPIVSEKDLNGYYFKDLTVEKFFKQ